MRNMEDKKTKKKIQTFFNTCLRRIFNIRWPEKIRNEELWERAGQEPVAKQILRRKWGWIRTKSCGSERDRNQCRKQILRRKWAGLDTPSGSQHPAPHAKP
nr:hypothetical protein BaRGS_006515 [Batillaria attramentaria]